MPAERSLEFASEQSQDRGYSSRSERREGKLAAS